MISSPGIRITKGPGTRRQHTQLIALPKKAWDGNTRRKQTQAQDIRLRRSHVRDHSQLSVWSLLGISALHPPRKSWMWRSGSTIREIINDELCDQFDPPNIPRWSAQHLPVKLLRERLCGQPLFFSGMDWSNDSAHDPAQRDVHDRREKFHLPAKEQLHTGSPHLPELHCRFHSYNLAFFGNSMSASHSVLPKGPLRAAVEPRSMASHPDCIPGSL